MGAGNNIYCLGIAAGVVEKSVEKDNSATSAVNAVMEGEVLGGGEVGHGVIVLPYSGVSLIVTRCAWGDSFLGPG